jgi:hypothetical protein
MKQLTSHQILKNITTYKQLIAIFESQKDYEAKARSEANLLINQNLLKECK